MSDDRWSQPINPVAAEAEQPAGTRDPDAWWICFLCMQPFANRDQGCGGRSSRNHRFVCGEDAARMARVAANLPSNTSGAPS